MLTPFLTMWDIPAVRSSGIVCGRCYPKRSKDRVPSAKTRGVIVNKIFSNSHRPIPPNVHQSLHGDAILQLQELCNRLDNQLCSKPGNRTEGIMEPALPELRSCWAEQRQVKTIAQCSHRRLGHTRQRTHKEGLRACGVWINAIRISAYASSTLRVKTKLVWGVQLYMWRL